MFPVALARGSTLLLLALALAGCPGRSDHVLDAGYDPMRGNAFDQPLSISDQRAIDLDPATLPATPSPCAPPALAVVTQITDGDTIGVSRISDGATLSVRMIGVNTPEIAHEGMPAELCGREAMAFTELLRGHYVWLTYDAGCMDGFGRDLAYVWIGPGDDGEAASDMWNRQLLRRGFARTITIAPNDAYADVFEGDRAAAEGAELVLWRTPSECTTAP